MFDFGDDVLVMLSDADGLARIAAYFADERVARAESRFEIVGCLGPCFGAEPQIVEQLADIIGAEGESETPCHGWHPRSLADCGLSGHGR